MKVFVDYKKGNDKQSEGSITKPFKTIRAAENYLNNEFIITIKKDKLITGFLNKIKYHYYKRFNNKKLFLFLSKYRNDEIRVKR